jgi:hypothetical protein
MSDAYVEQMDLKRERQQAQMSPEDPLRAALDDPPGTPLNDGDTPEE